MKPLVAIDEAGNSGGNLTDADQPVFVLASVSIDDSHASTVLPPRGREYKFTSLRRSTEGRRIIVDVLNSTELGESRYLVSAFHKRFMVVTKMVDLLVEPLAHKRGIDLYERGANLGLANLLYYSLPAILGTRFFEDLLERFVRMVRFPSKATLEGFYDLVETANLRRKNEESAMGIRMLLDTRAVAEAYLEEWDGSDLDPAIPAFFEHGAIWTQRLRTAFVIVHDKSKPIENEQIVLEAMMSETEVPSEIGYDRRKSLFPIAAGSIELRDSASCAQLQIADIIAGSVAYVLRATAHNKPDTLSRSLRRTALMSGSFRPVWPEPKFTPEELGTSHVGGVDAIEYIGTYVAKRLGGIPPKSKRRKK